MNKNKGFISITLVIVVSSILMVFTYVQSLEVLHFFDLTTHKQYRLMNYYNAYNCIDRVILNLSHDYFYEIHTPVKINDLNCSIDKVERSGSLINIETTGDYMRANVRRLAKARIHDDFVEIIFIE